MRNMFDACAGGEDVVPEVEIEKCLRRKRAFETDPEGHTYAEED